MKFELLPISAYTWRRKGQPLLIPTPGKNSRVAVCGAFRWPDGPFAFSHGLKGINTDLFLGLLKQLELRAKRTGKWIVLVLDNGSAHNSKRSLKEIERLKGLVQVFWLPTYTSEQLNEIEGVWKHLKEDYFSRMLVKRREDFPEAAVHLLDGLRFPCALRKALQPGRTKSVGRNIVRAA